MTQQKKILVRYLLPVIILALSVSIVIALVNTKPSAKQKNIEETAWVVDAVQITTGDHQPHLPLYGQILSNTQVDMTAAVEARVMQRLVNEGDKVTKGQTLVELDKTRIELQINQHKAEILELQSQIDDEKHRFNTDQILLKNEKKLLKLAKSAVKRAKTLEKSEMASSSQLDDALKNELTHQAAIAQREAAIRNHPTQLAKLDARLQQIKSRLALAKDDLQNTNIISPVNGVVSKMFIDQAEHVRKGNNILRLLDQEHIEIRSLLPEKQVLNIQQLLDDGFELAGQVNMGELTHPIKLHRLAGNVDKGLAGTYAYFRFKTAPKRVLIGQTVELSIALPALPNSINLPHEALYGTDSVFKIVDQRLVRTPVNWFGETRLVNGKLAILITSDKLKTGDTILVSKFANAMQGLKIELRNTDQ